jgi:hypothetical protein
MDAERWLILRQDQDEETLFDFAQAYGFRPTLLDKSSP